MVVGSLRAMRGPGRIVWGKRYFSKYAEMD